MSALDVIRQHIEIVEGAGGPKPRIAGIRVQDIVIWHEKLGMSPYEIVHDYPTFTIADVYAALAYYWDHHDEIEQRIEAEEAFAAEMKRLYPSPLQERLGRDHHK